MGNTDKFLRCKRCNRVLKKGETQVKGYGPVCYQKYLIENKPLTKSLFRTNQIGDVK